MNEVNVTSGGSQLAAAFIIWLSLHFLPCVTTYRHCALNCQLDSPESQANVNATMLATNKRPDQLINLILNSDKHSWARVMLANRLLLVTGSVAKQSGRNNWQAPSLGRTPTLANGQSLRPYCKRDTLLANLITWTNSLVAQFFGLR